MTTPAQTIAFVSGQTVRCVGPVYESTKVKYNVAPDCSCTDQYEWIWVFNLSAICLFFFVRLNASEVSSTWVD